MRKKRLAGVSIALVACLVFVGGCAKKTVKTGESATAGPAATTADVEPAPPAPAEPAFGEEEPLDSGRRSPAASARRIIEGRTTAPMLPIYFDFDKYNIRADQKKRLIANAEFLKRNPRLIVRIEGNCDERGTNEYNMALGERRAMSAKKYLVDLGIAAERIKIISYGEERPLNRGHDEYAWSQNRRDDFVIMD